MMASAFMITMVPRSAARLALALAVEVSSAALMLLIASQPSPSGATVRV